MTENKRFELDKYDCIYDNDSIAKDGGRETYWLIEYIQQKKLVEKMNKLADENKELKYKYDEKCNEYIGLEEQVEELLKENKELKEKCENYRQALSDLGINVKILDGEVE